MGRPRLHLTLGSADEQRLNELWKTTREKPQRDRLLVIRLAASGDHTMEEIAEVVGCGRMTVYRCLNRLEQGGWEELLRRGKPGASKSPLQEPQVQQQLQAKLRAGDFRTAGQVSRWLEQALGIKRKPSSLYYWLKKCGAVLRVPRPVHLKKDPLAGAAFPVELEAKLRALPLETGRPVRIWVQDEGRFGLHTIVRRCWGLRGVRVVKTNQKKYQWGYLYGALEIGTGKTEALFMPNVGLEVSETFLRHLAPERARSRARRHLGWGRVPPEGWHARPARSGPRHSTPSLLPGTQSDREAMGRPQRRPLQPPLPFDGGVVAGPLPGT